MKDASYRKGPLYIKYSSFNYASIGSMLYKIGATGESVEQFKITLFLERQNTFLRFLRISHKGVILQKKVPLYKIFFIKLRTDW